MKQPSPFGVLALIIVSLALLYPIEPYLSIGIGIVLMFVLGGGAHRYGQR